MGCRGKKHIKDVDGTRTLTVKSRIKSRMGKI